jgi:hypothetical protein
MEGWGEGAGLSASLSVAAPALTDPNPTLSPFGGEGEALISFTPLFRGRLLSVR